MTSKNKNTMQNIVLLT